MKIYKLLKIIYGPIVKLISLRKGMAAAKAIHFSLDNYVSAPIGAWEVKLEIMTERLNDRTTNQPT